MTQRQSQLTSQVQHFTSGVSEHKLPPYLISVAPKEQAPVSRPELTLYIQVSSALGDSASFTFLLNITFFLQIPRLLPLVWGFGCVASFTAGVRKPVLCCTPVPGVLA